MTKAISKLNLELIGKRRWLYMLFAAGGTLIVDTLRGEGLSREAGLVLIAITSVYIGGDAHIKSKRAQHGAEKEEK